MGRLWIPSLLGLAAAGGCASNSTAEAELRERIAVLESRVDTQERRTLWVMEAQANGYELEGALALWETRGKFGHRVMPVKVVTTWGPRDADLVRTVLVWLDADHAGVGDVLMRLTSALSARRVLLDVGQIPDDLPPVTIVLEEQSPTALLAALAQATGLAIAGDEDQGFEISYSSADD